MDKRNGILPFIRKKTVQVSKRRIARKKDEKQDHSCPPFETIWKKDKNWSRKYIILHNKKSLTLSIKSDKIHHIILNAMTGKK